MSTPHLTIELVSPVPVRSGDRIRARVSVDAVDATVGALHLRLAFPPEHCADLQVTDLLFTGADATGLATSVEESGAVVVAGARLNGPTGLTPVLEVTARVVAPAGRSAWLSVSSVSATALDGYPLDLDPATLTVDLVPDAFSIATTDIAHGRAGTPYSVALGARGGTPPYTWRVEGGALPPGMALGPAGELLGTPATSGTWSVAVSARDAAGMRADRTLQVHVDGALLRIVSAVLPTLAPGLPYAAPLAHVGGLMPVTWEVGDLPDGLALVDGAVTGTVAEVPATYGPIELKVVARDASEPPQEVIGRVTIPTAPLIAAERIPVPGAISAAIARDVVLVDYDVQLTITTHPPERGVAYDETVERLRNAILNELIQAVFEDSANDLREVFPDPFGSRGKDDRGNAKREQRVALLAEALRQLESGDLGTGMDVHVLFDGDSLLLHSGRATLRLRGTPRTSGLRSVGKLDRAARALWPMVRESLRPMLRRRLAALPPLARTHGATASKATETPSTHEAPAGPAPDGAAFRAADKGLERLDSGSLKERDTEPIVLRSDTGAERVRSRFWMAVAAATGVAGRARGWAGLLGTALAVTGALIAARSLVMFSLDRRLREVDRIVRDWEIVSEWDPIPLPRRHDLALRCTPGHHNLRVEWSAPDWPVALSEADREALFGAPSVTVWFTPRNPDGWPRLASPSEFRTGGALTDGGWESPILLGTPDLDLVIVCADRTVRVAPGRGDGTFAAPRMFATISQLPTAPVIAPVMDPIGRSSIVIAHGNDVSLWLNEGLHELPHRIVSAIAPPPHAALSLVAADINGDGWSEILVGAGRHLATIEGLDDAVQHGVTLGTTHSPIPSPVTNDEVVGLAASERIARPPSNTETRSGFAHALALLRNAGEGVLMRNDNNGRVGLPELVGGLDTADPRRRPIAVVAGDGFVPAYTVAIATQRPAEVRVMRPGRGGEPPLVPAARVPLRFRPGDLDDAPRRIGGLLLAQQEHGRVYLLRMGERGPLVHLIADLGDVTLDLTSGHGLSAAVGGDGVTLFR